MSSANVIDNSYKESTDVFELLDKAEQSFFELPTEPSKKVSTPQTLW